MIAGKRVLGAIGMCFYWLTVNEKVAGEGERRGLRRMLLLPIPYLGTRVDCDAGMLTFVSFLCVNSGIRVDEMLRCGRDRESRSTDTSSHCQSLLES